MATFLVLMQGHRRGSLGILAAGSAGAKGIADAIRRLGGELLGQYLVTGRYDLVVIARLPSTEAAVAFSLLQNALGFSAELLEALEPEAIDRVTDLADTVVGAKDEPGSDIEKEG